MGNRESVSLEEDDALRYNVFNIVVPRPNLVILGEALTLLIRLDLVDGLNIYSITAESDVKPPSPLDSKCIQGVKFGFSSVTMGGFVNFW